MLKITTSGATQIDLRLSRRIAALRNLRPQLEEATLLVYEATRQRFDSGGDGEWPPLAESTVARKASQGAGEPEKILYEFGNLYESATSPSGPYSTQIFPTDHAVVIGVDWEEHGHQIPMVLSEGDGHVPARPIWPDAEMLMPEVAAILLSALRGI